MTITVSASRKLSELPVATTLAGGEAMLVQQAAESRQVPVSAIWAPVSTLAISFAALTSVVDVALVSISAAVVEAEAASSAVAAFAGQVSDLDIRLAAVSVQTSVAVVAANSAVSIATVVSALTSVNSVHISQVSSRTSVNAVAIQAVSVAVSVVRTSVSALQIALTSVSAQVSALQVQLTSVSAAVSANVVAIQAVSVAVSIVRTSVSVAQVALAAVSALVSANTLQISLVSSAVSVQAVALTSVSARVSSLQLQLNTVSAAVSSNVVAIAATSVAVSVVRTSVSVAQVNIAAVSALVSVNALQISLVSSAVSANAVVIASVSALVSTLQLQISNVSTAVSVNVAAIQAVSAAVSAVRVSVSVLTSAALYFTVSASAGVSRLVHSKLADEVHVKDFGAVGNGITDDAAAIQAAINAVASVGGVVKFDAKPYAFSTPLSLTTRAVTLQGAGKNTFDSVDYGTVLEWTGTTSADWIAINGDTCNIFDMELRGSVVPVAGHAINIARTGLIGTRHTIQRVMINNSFNGINIHGFNYCHISDTYISGFFGDYAVRLYGDSTYRTDNLFLTRVVASPDASNTTGVGALFEGRCASIFGTDCYFSACNYGFHAKKNGAGDQPGAARWFRTAVENCITAGYYLESTAFITILNCFVGGCGVTSIGGGTGPGIRVGADCRGSIVLDNNDVRTCGEAGIVVEAGAAVVDIINSHTAANSQNGFGTYPGIEFQASCSGFGVTGGRAGGDIYFNPSGTKTHSYGIVLGANTANFNISSINVSGNITGAISDGTSAVGSIRGCVGYITEKSGTAVSVSTDGSGNVSISHGLDVLPTYVNLALLGDTVSNGVEVQAFTSTAITARVYDESTGADVTTGAFTIMWHARGNRA